jgi:hypothetical protein
MSLFQFELANVEDITPWGESPNLNLSWFALTDGTFRLNVGDQVLFQYTDQITQHLCGQTRDASYQIASLARDMLGSFASGISPLPPVVEALASDWNVLDNLRQASREQIEADDVSYAAWRWLGERSPWTSYFVAHPQIHFVRIRDDVHIHWDNRDRFIDSIPVWTAQKGTHVLNAHAFEHECRDFADRLLENMSRRIALIECGRAKPQVSINIEGLRTQHETWCNEFQGYFAPALPDIPWSDTVAALQAIAKQTGMALPVEP